MSFPVAALGEFVFAPHLGSYESLERIWTFAWAKPDPVGSPPLKQFMGKGDEELVISGGIWPEIQLPGLWKLEELAAVAGTGETLPFMLGSGRVLGLWCVEEITSTSGEIERFGFPGEIDFSITLSRDPGGLGSWPF